MSPRHHNTSGLLGMYIKFEKDKGIVIYSCLVIIRQDSGSLPKIKTVNMIPPFPPLLGYFLTMDTDAFSKTTMC